MKKGLLLLVIGLTTGIGSFARNNDSKFIKDVETDTTTVKEPAPATEPFAFGYFSWLNGNSRKTTPPLIDSKYFTSDITLDLNSTYSFNGGIFKKIKTAGWPNNRHSSK